MIKILFGGAEKTGSYRPESWKWTTYPFPAFRVVGQRYSALLAVANGFTPWLNSLDLANNKAMSDDFCKIITTERGTRLLVPCTKADDERILLITASGGYRSSFREIEAIGAEILWQNGASTYYCPVKHIIARITEPNGYIRTETGRRRGSGYTEVYSWKGGYFGMYTEEYDAAVDIGVLFAAHDTAQSDLEICKAKRVVEAVKTKDKTVRTEAEAIWKPQFMAASKECAFPEYRDSTRHSSLRFYPDCVRVRIESDGKCYDYSEEGLAQFKSDIPIHEEKYKEILRLQAKS